MSLPTRSAEPIEGRYEVIQPPPKVDWSFWRDDMPALLQIIGSCLGALLVIIVAHGLFP